MCVYVCAFLSPDSFQIHVSIYTPLHICSGKLDHKLRLHHELMPYMQLFPL